MLTNDARTDAELALESLYRARRYLKAAKSWGIADVLGGQSAITALKQMEIQKAKRNLKRANYNLSNLMDDLKILGIEKELSADIGAIAVILDYAFDGVFADFLVQTKIKKSIEDVDDAIDAVKSIRSRL